MSASRSSRAVRRLCVADEPESEPARFAGAATRPVVGRGAHVGGGGQADARSSSCALASAVALAGVGGGIFDSRGHGGIDEQAIFDPAAGGRLGGRGIPAAFSAALLATAA